MKKLLFSFCAVGLILFLSAQVMAGGAINRTNWSAEYIRTLNRNAATDAADIALYNPAGTVKMDDGFYGNISVHYASKNYANNIDFGTNAIQPAFSEQRESDKPSFIPGLFGVYKKNNWSVFGAISNHGGGGAVDYGEGTLTTRQLGYGMWGLALNPVTAPIFGGAGPGPISNEKIEGQAHYVGYNLGAAYKINNIFSVSAAAKYIDAKREASEVTASVTNAAGTFTERAAYDEDATGLGGVFGLNISPSKDWNIGMRYETNVKLNFKQKVTQDSLGLLPFLGPALGVTDGGVVRKDLPAIGAFGVSYRFLEKFRVEANLTYYFNENSHNDDWLRTGADVDDGYDIGILLEYMFSEKWLASLGYMHTKTGVKPEDMNPESPELDANTIGAGAAWRPMPALTLNFSIGNAFYTSDSFTYTGPAALAALGINDKVEYEKNNFFAGFGVEYKFK
jgi:long-chain fatty acid transport protein